MAKKNCNITVEETLWDLLKTRLPYSRSEFFERQAKLHLDIDDPEAKIVKKIEKKQNEINVLKNQLCTIRENKKKELNDEKLLSKPMETLKRIHERSGCIGLNQIRMIAKNHNASSDILEKHCRAKEMNVVNFYESPK